ncbi:sigma factor [Streptomyces sp. NPDC051976]|uniref:sigma factor n=1 Tax=Streptomyces sp. NPDC051976 TaxID=3154947 RepID=UPI003421C3B0
MDDSAWPLERFEEHREHLRAVAYRMLGSLSEADDAVQEAWLRVRRADARAEEEADDGAGGEDGPRGIENVGGWLTTIVARVCLNMLRTRERQREDPLDGFVPDPVRGHEGGPDPEQEALLADSVGLAMLVVLDTLAPAERVSFVLHDMFAVPFDAIGPLLERSPAAARQLASRARRRVRGGAPVVDIDLARQRRVVTAFQAAAREGDFEALLALLDPDVVLRADAAAGPTPAPVVLHGIDFVAKGASAAAGRVRFTQIALVDGAVGLVMAPRGKLRVVLTFTVSDAGITAIDVIADPERLRALEIAVLDA